MERYGGRTAIVTGAASGIGRATVLRLIDEGATVLGVDRDEGGLAATREAVRDPGRVSTLAGDVADPDTAAVAVAAARDLGGGVDLLVNGAGILRFEHTHEAGLDTWEQILRVNLTGTFLFCRAAIPALLERQGAIVNVASTSSTYGHPWAAAYASSKGGVLALTKTLAVEYAKQGLRVNAVCPGSIDTPITGAFQLPDGADPKLVRRIMSPTGMAGPEVVAAAIAYLGSGDAHHVNGADLRIDGGTHA